MFNSLRSRLVTSYLLIAFLSLALATGTTLVLMQQYQQRGELVRLNALAISLARRLPDIFTSTASPRDFLRSLRQEALRFRMRLLLLDSEGVIQYDTALEGSLVGQQVRIPPDLLPSDDRALVRRHRLSGELEFFLVIVPLPAFEAASNLSGRAPYVLALAAPVREVRPPWREMLPPLTASAIVALIVSAVVGLFLSRSMTRPLSAMSRAAQEIARGNYQQRISAQGKDEISQLANSFNRMAQEVDRSQQTQRDFIANVSHDLKTPLTSIQGFSQAILEGAVTAPEGYQRAAEIIYDESERMDKLVTDLLKLARLEAGQAKLVRERVDLEALLASCGSKFAPRFTGASIDFRMEIDPLPVVEGDGGRLEEVMDNLLDNATNYAGRGAEVLLRAWEMVVSGGNCSPLDIQSYPLPTGMSLQDGRWILIAVSDNGPGIAPEDLPHVFERFYRADKSRGKSEGSGLGLAIAKEIVIAHGGHIGVNSGPEGGTTFVMALPVLRDVP
jgi:signal transduction histidine kinase